MQLTKALVVSTIVSTIMAVSGCATTAPSSLGLYSDAAGPHTVKGSSAQAVVKRTIPYTADEVRDAAETTLFRKGLNVEEKDATKGRVTASGGYRHMCAGGPCDVIVTVAVYVTQISPKPSTEVTLLVDRHTLSGWGGSETTIANDIISEMQKVLTTYR